MRYLLAQGLEPMVLLATRLGIAGFIGGLMGVCDLKRRPLSRANLPVFLIFGLLILPVSYACFLWAVATAPVGVAVMLAYTAPIYIVLGAVPLLGERLDAARGVALAMAVGGCALVAVPGLGRGQLTTVGVLWSLLAGITYAANVLGTKVAVGRVGARPLVSWGLFLCGLELCVIECGHMSNLAVLDAMGWAALAGIAVIGVVVANIFYIGGIERVEAGRASIITTVEPLCAVIFAYVFLGERLLSLQALGGTMIIAGAVLAQGGGGATAKSGLPAADGATAATADGAATDGGRRGFRREFSAGGVVYRGGDPGGPGAEILMVRDRFGRWSFPKGIIDRGETAAEAAQREVMEECGVTGVVVERLGNVSYYYTNPDGDRVKKQVTYFLMRHAAGEATPQEGEIDDVAWVPVDEVAARSAYPSQRELVERAVAAIRGPAGAARRPPRREGRP